MNVAYRTTVSSVFLVGGLIIYICGWGSQSDTVNILAPAPHKLVSAVL